MQSVFSLFEEPLTFVDIETTGARVVSDRIIEIGILRVENGAITQTYESLLNPQQHVSPFISQFTGITADELEGAPYFEDVKDEIQEILEGSIFVAHNVRFDYGFLKNEFRRFGISYSAKNMCSAQFSRLLFPRHRHHNLDSIIERFGLEMKRRHRAFDDAKAIYDFFHKIPESASMEAIAAVAKRVCVRTSLPAELRKQVDVLPESPGIYLFYDASGLPLYVGKSTNIKARVLSHFSNDYNSTKEMNMCRQVSCIEFEQTSGELGALLTESSRIKSLQPIYNRVLRDTKLFIIGRYAKNGKGYYEVMLETVKSIGPDDVGQIIGIFKSVKQAKSSLDTLCKEARLCGKLLHLENGRGACFLSKLNICNGACVGKESPDLYNARLLEAFESMRIHPWPYEKPIVIVEQDGEEGEGFIVDNWCLTGKVRYDSYEQTIEEDRQMHFDKDVYKILRRFLRNPKNRRQIKLLDRQTDHTRHDGYFG